MPVPAVIAGGMPTVSSGSAITTEGSTLGWKMIFFLVGFVLVRTEARPTSEPVPAVVGTATLGDRVGIGAGPPVADVLEIPDRAGLPGHEGDHLGKVEPGAAAKGDHPVMARRLEGRDPGLQVGLRRVRVHFGEQGAAQAAGLHQVQRRAVIGSAASPRSVTSRGRAMPAAAQASAISEMRPAPKRMAVG
jgi:hypothetical protein